MTTLQTLPLVTSENTPEMLCSILYNAVLAFEITTPQHPPVVLAEQHDLMHAITVFVGTRQTFLETKISVPISSTRWYDYALLLRSICLADGGGGKEGGVSGCTSKLAGAWERLFRFFMYAHKTRSGYESVLDGIFRWKIHALNLPNNLSSDVSGFVRTEFAYTFYCLACYMMHLGGAIELSYWSKTSVETLALSASCFDVALSAVQEIEWHAADRLAMFTYPHSSINVSRHLIRMRKNTVEFEFYACKNELVGTSDAVAGFTARARAQYTAEAESPAPAASHARADHLASRREIVRASRAQFYAHLAVLAQNVLFEQKECDHLYTHLEVVGRSHVIMQNRRDRMFYVFNALGHYTRALALILQHDLVHIDGRRSGAAEEETAYEREVCRAMFEHPAAVATYLLYRSGTMGADAGDEPAFRGYASAAKPAIGVVTEIAYFLVSAEYHILRCPTCIVTSSDPSVQQEPHHNFLQLALAKLPSILRVYIEFVYALAPAQLALASIDEASLHAAAYSDTGAVLPFVAAVSVLANTDAAARAAAVINSTSSAYETVARSTAVASTAYILARNKLDDLSRRTPGGAAHASFLEPHASECVVLEIEKALRAQLGLLDALCATSARADAREKTAFVRRKVDLAVHITRMWFDMTKKLPLSAVRMAEDCMQTARRCRAWLVAAAA